MERKWGSGGPGELESPELRSDTGTDAGIGGNGLKGVGPGEFCTALRNCQKSMVNMKIWASPTVELKDL